MRYETSVKNYKIIILITGLAVFLAGWNWIEREKTINSIVEEIQKSDAQSFIQAGIDSRDGDNITMMEIEK